LRLEEVGAALGHGPTEHVRALIREFRRRGVAQIVISHRLQDVFASEIESWS
jgi:ABC-type sugar transport system ATPase subunit